MRADRHAAWMCTGLVLLACQASAPSNAPSAGPPLAAPPAAPSAGAPHESPPSTPAPSSAMRKFAEDVEFLTKHGAVKVLESPSGGRIVVSGKYQGRVMTSAVESTGASLGFVNRAFIEQGKTGTAFDNYGGEDRFWLGPEGGQYALYFAPGKPFEFANWQTPPAFQEGEWLTKGDATATSVTFVRTLDVVNYARAEFHLDVERKVSVYTDAQVQSALGLAIPEGVKWVAFSSENTITSKSKQAWADAKGLPSIWILGMFAPAPGTRIIAPFDRSGTGPIVNDRYFGKVPTDRLIVDESKGFLLFKADGQLRSKIGLGPTRAKDVLGSYSPDAKLLTIVRYTRPTGATRYVNNLWEVSKEPYGGDVNNAYNDGPVEPGKPSLGGFYELESSSPAAALKPGGSLTHTHETYHFTGTREALEAISLKVLGVSLTDVESAKL